MQIIQIVQIFAINEIYSSNLMHLLHISIQPDKMNEYNFMLKLRSSDTYYWQLQSLVIIHAQTFGSDHCP